MSRYLLPEAAPTREAVNALRGPVLLEFGTGWCGYCRALAPIVEKQLEDFPEVQHLKVEDGSGRPLGRSFSVKLWPTLVFLRNGHVVEQAARPDVQTVRQGLKAITTVDHQSD